MTLLWIYLAGVLFSAGLHIGFFNRCSKEKSELVVLILASLFSWFGAGLIISDLIAFDLKKDIKKEIQEISKKL